MHRLKIGLMTAVITGLILIAACSDPVTGTDQDNNVPEDTLEIPEIPGYTLVWHDEFNDSLIDLSSWNIIDRENSHNEELQYYTPEDVYLDSGCLVLRSQKRNFSSKLFTSGLVHSQNKKTFTYGYFEIRAMLPGGQGLWPAHWMLPDDGRWPPEIDIMEFLGHDVHTIHMTTHWGIHSDGWHPSDHNSYTSPSTDYTADFHIFSAEWDSSSVRFYVDRILRHTVTEGVPDDPFYIILNTAVGGTWPGNPDASTVFPQYHRIDYVRVYEKTHQ